MPSPPLPAGPSERLVYERALPAVPVSVSWMRRELDAVLEGLGVATARRHDVSLVLTEAAANVVVHAYHAGRPGLLYTLALLTGSGLRIDVFDTGQGMVAAAPSQGLGVGLALMARLADGLEIATNDSGGMQVSAVFNGISGEPPKEPIRDRAERLADYIDVLQGVAEALRDDTRVLIAEAEAALDRARTLRNQRRRSALS
jgi:serine/threonine-protein kinase RsbW